LTGFIKMFSGFPRVVAALQPWAEISQRLRRIKAAAFGRILCKFQTEAPPFFNQLKKIQIRKRLSGTKCPKRVTKWPAALMSLRARVLRFGFDANQFQRVAI